MSMGIQNISEEDLEAYTRGKFNKSSKIIIIFTKINFGIICILFRLSDFSRLVEGHLEQDDPTSSAGSHSDGPQETGPGKRHQPRTHGAPSSAHGSGTQHTPVHTSFALQQPGSAVFKVGEFLSL